METTSRTIAILMAALLFAWPATAAGTPQDFMASLNAKYRTMDRWPRGYQPCSEFCEPRLSHLVSHANDRDEAALDYDPICQCQDTPPNLPVQSIRPKGGSAAEVTLRRGKTMWILILHREGGRWRIADVVEQAPGLGSLMVRLTNSRR